MRQYCWMLFATLACSSGVALAAEPLFKNTQATGDPHMCSLKASVFEGAATARDHNGTPELARQMTAAYKDVPQPFREKAIKMVFENPAFDLPGRQLYRIVLNQCMYKGGFQ